MRIVAIGLGGAGSRIVNRLYASDRRSSKVACVQGIAVDVDDTTLKNVAGLPEQGRLFFPPLDMGLSLDRASSSGPTATIDISEIVSKVQNLQSGETDAILICCGLGGSMVDVAPHIIAGLRSSVTEPIFGLLTLPCLAEGERKSSKAADDIDMLQPLLDGIILFDNETWYRKIKAERAHLSKKEAGFAEKLGIKKSDQEVSPVQATYSLLNDGIVRRISLILRAGEFKADGGIDLAEVVLDSGEVLNTMKGMGFITIGYAVERLPPDPLGFLSRFKPAGIFNEEQKKKASRIVELAKQAIYHEISTPCDMTSAHKALVLIAGPSHELSMKGFMTVRKWIDRSIAGLETRSGDYPVMNTKNVAIIVMLSGLENIPRLTEIREIRSQFTDRKPQKQGEMPSTPIAATDYDLADEIAEGSDLAIRAVPIKDTMITIPARHQPAGRSPVQAPISSSKPRISLQDPDFQENDGSIPKKTPPSFGQEPVTDGKNRPRPLVRSHGSHGEGLPRPGEHKGDSPGQEREILSRRLIVSKSSTEQHIPKSRQGTHKPEIAAPPSGRSIGGSLPPESGSIAEKAGPRLEQVAVRGKESERQRIERELQRQRELAIPGSTKKTLSQPSRTQVPVPVRQDDSNNDRDHDEKDLTRGRDTSPVIQARTVILSRKSSKPPIVDSDRDVSDTRGSDREEEIKGEHASENPDSGENITFRRKTELKAKDGIFEGQPTRRTVVTPQARDAGMIHTNINTKKRADVSDHSTKDERENPENTSPESDEKEKKRRKSSSHDDFSWV